MCGCLGCCVPVLQSTIAAAVLPLWSHTELPAANLRITTALISVLTNCTTGTAAASQALGRMSTGVRPTAAPSAASVDRLVDMGFPRARAEEALWRVSSAGMHCAQLLPVMLSVMLS